MYFLCHRDRISIANSWFRWKHSINEKWDQQISSGYWKTSVWWRGKPFEQVLWLMPRCQTWHVPLISHQRTIWSHQTSHMGPTSKAINNRYEILMVHLCGLQWNTGTRLIYFSCGLIHWQVLVHTWPHYPCWVLILNPTGEGPPQECSQCGPCQ